MQQYISSAEACTLLDRVLQTVQSLKTARAMFVQRIQVQAPPPPPPQPEEALVSSVIEAEPALPPTDTRRVAPVLTIKLADLVQAGNAARARRVQTGKSQRTASRPQHNVRKVEILYRKGFRLVS